MVYASQATQSHQYFSRFQPQTLGSAPVSPEPMERHERIKDLQRQINEMQHISKTENWGIIGIINRFFLSKKLDGISEQLKRLNDELNNQQEQLVNTLSRTSQETETQAPSERVLPSASVRRGAEQNITATLAFNIFGYPLRVCTIQFDQFVSSK